jgi:hypothetical protein
VQNNVVSFPLIEKAIPFFTTQFESTIPVRKPNYTSPFVVLQEAIPIVDKYRVKTTNS